MHIDRHLNGDLPGGSRFTERNKCIWKPRMVHGVCVLNTWNPQWEKQSQVSEAELECAHACQGKGFLS